MLLKRLFFCSLILANVGAILAQPIATPLYFVQGSPAFKVNGKQVTQPMIGGFNSTEFYPIDINNDGVDDLICFDRNDNKLLPFLRSKDSVFTYAPQYERYFPTGFYYYKTADLNSDGKLDIFTLDETSSLIIHRNRTKAGDSFVKFDDLGSQYYRNQYVPPFPILYNAFSLSRNDLPEISDIDRDGDLDIITYDAFYGIYVKYADVRVEKGWSSDTFEFQKMDVCFGYFNDFNFAITLGSCPYLDKLSPRHAGGAALLMYDEDEDGDKEMVLSNIGFKPMWKLKNGRKDYAHKYDTMVHWDSIFPRNTLRASTYDFPAGFLFDADGDKVNDLIIAPNGFSDVKETHQLWYYRNFGKNNKPDFRFVKDNFLGDQTLDLGASSVPAFVDIDADGDQDLFVASNGDFELTGGVADRIAFFENIGTPKVPQFDLKTTNYLNMSNKGISDMVIQFGDIDGDLDNDLLMGNRMGYVLWYKNTAGPNKPCVFVLQDTNFVGANAAPGESNAAPMVWDYNNDKLPDLLVGYYNGRVVCYKNTGTIGNPQFSRQPNYAWGMRANEWQENVNPVGFSSYGYAIPTLIDMDNNGTKEIVIGTAYGTPRLYYPEGYPLTDSLPAMKNWLWQRNLTDSALPDLGARIAPAVADLNGDSIPEIIFGNARGGLIMTTSTFTKLTGIKQQPKVLPEFSMFPNPSSSILQIHRNLSPDQWVVRIYDASTKLVYNGNMDYGQRVLAISTERLTQGFYIVEIKSPTGNSSEKLLVQRN